MERANPVDLRKAMKAAEEYKRAGVMFIPMPVLNEQDRKELIAECERRICVLIAEAEKCGS